MSSRSLRRRQNDSTSQYETFTQSYELKSVTHCIFAVSGIFWLKSELFMLEICQIAACCI